MRDKQVFYGMCVFAVLVVGAIGIGYATDILPRPKQVSASEPVIEKQAPSSKLAGDTDASSAVKDQGDCSCCEERRAKVREMLERRLRRRAAQSGQDLSK